MKKEYYIRLFLSIIIILIIFICSKESFKYLFFIICHEAVHIITAAKLGYRTDKFLILPFGVTANIKDDIINPIDDILISLSGPLFNLIIAVLFYFLYIQYGYDYIYFKVNIVLMLFNLIPAGFLDGGRILKDIIKVYYSFYYSEFLIYLNGIIFGCIILFITIYEGNIFKFLIKALFGVYFIFVSFQSRKSINYRIIKDFLYKGFYLKNKNNYKVELRGFNIHAKLFDVIKTFCFKHYYIIYVMDGKNPIKKIDEGDIIKAYLSYGNISLDECLKYDLQEEDSW